MAEITFWGGLDALAGARRLHLDVATYDGLLAALRHDHGLGAEIDRGLAVSIDGHIRDHADAPPLTAESRVIILPKFQGG